MQVAADVRERVDAERDVGDGKDNERGKQQDEGDGLPGHDEEVHDWEGEDERHELVRPGHHGRRGGGNLRWRRR